jgi:hypothetical protein
MDDSAEDRPPVTPLPPLPCPVTEFERFIDEEEGWEETGFFTGGGRLDDLARIVLMDELEVDGVMVIDDEEGGIRLLEMLDVDVDFGSDEPMRGAGLVARRPDDDDFGRPY